MAPIRRYLRISAYSVLEVRIYLDNPSDASRWLLHSSDPALPRIITAVRPLVLPKLREENERQKKGSKKKSVKDVVTGEDFEVSIFLTELSTPHAILTRAKVFGEKGTGKVGEGGVGSKGRPLEVGDEDGQGDGEVPGLVREESDEDKVDMGDIPMAGAESNTANDPVEVDDDDEEDVDDMQAAQTRRNGRRKQTVNAEASDDKKKLGFKTNYEGFRIHGRILCLVVKCKTAKRGQVTADNTGQAMMENWIASTQEHPAMLDE